MNEQGETYQNRSEIDYEIAIASDAKTRSRDCLRMQGRLPALAVALSLFIYINDCITTTSLQSATDLSDYFALTYCMDFDDLRPLPYLHSDSHHIPKPMH